MRTPLLLVLVSSLLVACEDKPQPGTTPSTPAAASAAAATDTTPAVPIAAGAALTAADGSTKRTWSGDHFEVVVSAPACKAKTGCTAEIQLVAKPGYHINEEYPYRFTAKPSGGVAYKGKEAAEVFSKAAGDFSKASASEAKMQVRYEADGSVKKIPLSGIFKMSVCSEASCQIETPTLDVDVPVQS